MDSADVVIAGAGIIGLSTALELAQSGQRVIVLERGEAMSESSWAAAGMLAAGDPENPPPLQPLSDLSRRLYPEYLASIESLSGIRVPLRTSRTLQAVRRERKMSASRILSSREASELLPGLEVSRHEFLLLDEPSLDPRDLCRALPEAVRATGVDLRERIPAIAIEPLGNSLVVETSANPISATHFINCCGAWSAELPIEAGAPSLRSKLTLPSDFTQPGAPSLTASFAGKGGTNPIHPRKGQMAKLKLPPDISLPCVLRTPEIYLVPRGDGQVILGATVEHAGFDKRVDPAAIERLHHLAAEIWPPIARAEVVGTWAGLRPGTPDDLPHIGPSLASNCWIAAGHFRNGILLAPATARVVGQLVRGQQPAIDLAPFAPERFGDATRQRLRESDKSPVAAL